MLMRLDRMETTKRGGEKRDLIVVLLAAVLITLVIVSLMLGRYGLTLDEIFQAVRHHITGTGNVVENAETVMFKVRIPRILASVFVGAALAASGAVYQGLFRNPMVSPDLMGASSGAGFGAALALLISCTPLQVQIISFVFGIAAVVITYSISNAVGLGGNSQLSLVLTGIVVSTLFSSFISLIKYVADPNSKLPSITYWLMGGFSSITEPDLPLLVLPIFIGLVPMLLLRYRLNVLSFGDEEAKSLGVNMKSTMTVFVAFSTLTISASVAASGIIGWVGLVIPHLVRIIVGPNYSRLLPASMLLGAIYLLLIDNIARLVSSAEIPIGILTSIIGAPFFVYLLVKGKKSWS